MHPAKDDINLDKKFIYQKCNKCKHNCSEKHEQSDRNLEGEQSDFLVKKGLNQKHSPYILWHSASKNKNLFIDFFLLPIMIKDSILLSNKIEKSRKNNINYYDIDNIFNP